jgi:hypothetical protein
LERSRRIELEDPWVVAGVGLGVLTIIVALLIYYVGIKRPDISVAVWTPPLAGSTDSEEPSYVGVANPPEPTSGEPALVLTSIALWNSGNRGLYGTQISPSNPLMISCTPPAAMVSVEKVDQSTDNSKIDVTWTPGDSSIRVSFGHLERTHGVAIEVLHTGKSSADFGVSGHVIDGRESIRVLNPWRRYVPGVFFFATFVYAIGAAQLTAGVFPFWVNVLLVIPPAMFFFWMAFHITFHGARIALRPHHRLERYVRPFGALEPHEMVSPPGILAFRNPWRRPKERTILRPLAQQI